MSGKYVGEHKPTGQKEKEAVAANGTLTSTPVASPSPSAVVTSPVGENTPQPTDGGEQVTAVRVPAGKWILVDGGYQLAPSGSFILKYEDQTFFSKDMIRDLYDTAEYGDSIIVRGLPFLGNKLFETSGIVNLNPIFNKLKEKLEDNMKKGKIAELTESYDGMTITWGEVGLQRLVLNSPRYSTMRGIHVGSTREDVQKAYGRLGQPDATSWKTFLGIAEFQEGDVTEFIFEQDIVKEIRYGWK
ncbi:hypothetical protein [Gorillibacterium massiliense]|uniref:hypothetical protein n=1 Tax=Gorillibacterium massiliense TaxID=1280390 RepID=UPI0012DCC582|nr:hypothetical protein [Gorillibacterium massiliense]